MQIIYQNEDERSSSKRVDPIGIVIYIGWISQCLKEKYIRGLRRRFIRI